MIANVNLPTEEELLLKRRRKEFEDLCESHQSIQRLELAKIVPQQNVFELRSQAVKRLQECGVVCIRPIRGKFENFKLPSQLLPNNVAHVIVELPFELASLTEQSIAVSYRHGGNTIRCRVKTEDGTGFFELLADEHAIEACMATGKLGLPFWIDCVCIQSAGHSVSEAFGYMGHLYASLPVFSQINWRQSKEDVLDYMSRCWVFQEFLIAEQYILPHIYHQIVSKCAKLQTLGKRVQEILARCVSTPPKPGAELRELSTDFDQLLPEMKQVLDTFECRVLSYWFNCVQTMWLFQMTRLGAILRGTTTSASGKNLLADNQIELGAQLVDAVASCSCIPLILFISKEDVDRAIRLQMPTTDILGRLENAYIQLDVHTELDRPYAIFGVYNKLAGDTTSINISGPAFRGLWPAIRGTKLSSQNCTSGFSSGTFVYLNPLCRAEGDDDDDDDDVMVSVEILVPFDPPKGGADRPRFVIVAYEKTETTADDEVIEYMYTGRAIWTYGCLPASCSSGSGQALKAACDCIRVFVEEIDSLFGVATGRCTFLFKKLIDTAWSSAPFTFTAEVEAGSLYTKRIQFALEGSQRTKVP